jgi:hypothetical protein
VPVSVTSVAAAAGVSRTFLYDSAQRGVLTWLRVIAAGRGCPPRVTLTPAEQRISTASYERVVRALRDRNHRLS